MGDVDILALDEWQRSRQLLEQAGYVEQERADHARSYLAPESGVVVELHHSLTSCPGLFPLDREGLWSRRRQGAGGALPSAEDTLVQLGLHAAFQHGLGLRLVQMLARQLEGTVETTSGTGPGTEFLVRFVAREVEGVPGLTESATSTKGGGGA